jgi:phosphoglycerate dehydrogenase-like enzyme
MAARLTAETRGLIGARELALLRPEAIFVNTARAELVDQAALREALARRAFAGAVLDVYSPEPPLRDDPLLGRDDVLLTPHIAGATREAASNGADVVAARVAAYLANGSLDGCANRQAIAATPAPISSSSPGPSVPTPSPLGRGSG